MNKRPNMMQALANAFDKAAVTCHTKEQAARFILEQLNACGFYIVPGATLRADDAAKIEASQ